MTMLVDEPEVIGAAVTECVKVFTPFIGQIIRLRLCEFWPGREIAVCELTGVKTDGTTYRTTDGRPKGK